MSLAVAPIDFALPEENIARQPIESSPGSRRDDARLMVLRSSSGNREHVRFQDLGDHLSPGDVLVVNSSRTLPAALVAETSEGDEVLVHVATPLAEGLWSVEVRMPTPGGGSKPQEEPQSLSLKLSGGASLHLLTRDQRSKRLWIAAVEGVTSPADYLSRHGQPIRYEPGPALPMSDYQTVFANEPGSAEMPSAGRPFSTEMVAQLITAGVVVVPIVLHSGISSYETGERPGPEQFEVAEQTATVVNALRSTGGRVIAVGTTVVRALETTTDSNGIVHPGRGSTDLIVTAASGVKVVDGLLTGWHEPRSSHLDLLEAFVGRQRLAHVYDEAMAEGYRWHEFGDSLLILP